MASLTDSSTSDITISTEIVSVEYNRLHYSTNGVFSYGTRLSTVYFFQLKPLKIVSNTYGPESRKPGDDSVAVLSVYLPSPAG